MLCMQATKLLEPAQHTLLFRLGLAPAFSSFFRVSKSPFRHAVISAVQPLCKDDNLDVTFMVVKLQTWPIYSIRSISISNSTVPQSPRPLCWVEPLPQVTCQQHHDDHFDMPKLVLFLRPNVNEIT